MISSRGEPHREDLVVDHVRGLGIEIASIERGHIAAMDSELLEVVARGVVAIRLQRVATASPDIAPKTPTDQAADAVALSGVSPPERGRLMKAPHKFDVDCLISLDISRGAPPG